MLMLFKYHCYAKVYKRSEMDIAVIGSNMVDLITYTNRCLKKEKLWKHLPSKSDVVERC